MTIAEKLIEKGKLEGKMEGERKGKLEGKMEGKLEGKLEGERTLLIRLIERKWGTLPSDINKRLNKINTSEELEALGEKIIVCQSIEDLFEDAHND